MREPCAYILNIKLTMLADMSHLFFFMYLFSVGLVMTLCSVYTISTQTKVWSLIIIPHNHLLLVILLKINVYHYKFVTYAHPSRFISSLEIAPGRKKTEDDGLVYKCSQLAAVSCPTITHTHTHNIVVIHTLKVHTALQNYLYNVRKLIAVYSCVIIIW